MADRILGLDIGTDTIKAVLVARSFRGGNRVLGTAAVPVAQNGGVTEALEELFRNQAFRGCDCVTALSVQALSFRNLVLPFREEKKIRQVVSFEVEPALHYNVEHAIVDFIVIRQGLPSDILVAAAPKTAVLEMAAPLSQYVKRISRLDVEGAALAAALHDRFTDGSSALVLDIGADHSTGLLIQDGRIVQIRPFSFCGNRITQAVTQTLKIDRDEAEQRKRENRAGEAGSVIAAQCEHFFSEVDQTIEYMRLQGHLKRDPERIYFTGGGSLYPPFREALSAHFGTPAEPLDLLAAYGLPADQAVLSGWNPSLMNQALALAIASHKKGLGFNIKIQDSKFKTAVNRHKDTLYRAAVALFIVFFLAGADAYLDYRYNLKRLNALKAETASLFKALIPEATRIIDPVSQLKGKLGEARKVTAGMGEFRAGATVLSLLKDIAVLAPPATELTVDTLTLDQDVMLLKGQARNYETVESLRNEFMKSKFFQTVTIGGTTLLKQGDRVAFELRVMLKK